MIWYYVAAIIILLISSIAHELGHILALLAFGVPVHKLSVGFGPVWCGKNLKGQKIKRIRIKIVPFGLGAAFDGDNPRFQSLGFWQKMIIFSAGVLVNIAIAGIVFLLSRPLDVLQPTHSGHDPVNITRAFVVLNLMVALFQLLPFSKFDGGRMFDCTLKKIFPKSKPNSVINLKILIALLVGFLIFHIYRAWI